MHPAGLIQLMGFYVSIVRWGIMLSDLLHVQSFAFEGLGDFENIMLSMRFHLKTRFSPCCSSRSMSFNMLSVIDSRSTKNSLQCSLSRFCLCCCNERNHFFFSADMARWTVSHMYELYFAWHERGRRWSETSLRHIRNRPFGFLHSQHSQMVTARGFLLVRRGHTQRVALPHGEARCSAVFN